MSLYLTVIRIAWENGWARVKMDLTIEFYSKNRSRLIIQTLYSTDNWRCYPMSLGLGVLEEIGAEFHQFPTVRKKGVAVPSFLSSFPPHHPSSPLSPCLSFPSPLGFFHSYRCSQVSNTVSYCSPPLVFKTDSFPFQVGDGLIGG